MTLKLQFEANQEHQLNAISALIDVFSGQQQRAVNLAPILGGEEVGTLPGMQLNENGIGNWLYLSEEQLLKNVREIQGRNNIADAGSTEPLLSWSVHDPLLEEFRECHQFTIEMETGTGKTYVFLRSIMELAERYGYRKFVIVVPSVAIREGTLSNLEMLKPHLSGLYSTPLNYFVYDSKNVSRLREFALSDSVQIMVINIQAFVKAVSDEEGESRGGKVIYKPSDALSGRRPIDFVHAARPVVIIDEPQSVDSTKKAKESIAELNPMFVVRYSATHRERYNLLYVLDPIQAFELKLVKQIWVSEVLGQTGGNDARVVLESVESDPLSAKIRINFKTKDAVTEHRFTVKEHSDLFELSKGLPAYQSGFVVTEISREPDDSYVRFDGGSKVSLGTQIGGAIDEIWRYQIEKTVEHHFDKVLEIHNRGLKVKVLSLFFIDKVLNYRVDPENPADQGKFAIEFETAFVKFAADPRFAGLPISNLKPQDVHKGYFSRDKKGFRDSKEGKETAADEDTFTLIMRSKERLLSPEEPVQFIFSHSALREGWDNPNVFQICTLNETTSRMKKRQEIGRGLRVPVDHTGKRVFDDSLNRLVVVANESYEDFARKLQTEYEVDAGVVFGRVTIEGIVKVLRTADGGNTDLSQSAAREVAVRIQLALREAAIIDDNDRIAPGLDSDSLAGRIQVPEEYEELVPAVVDLIFSSRVESQIRVEANRNKNPVKKEVFDSTEFQLIWEKIRPRTTYALNFDSSRFINDVAEKVGNAVRENVSPVKVTSRTARINPEISAITGTTVATGEDKVLDLSRRPLQDVLSYIQQYTDLTRTTVLQILKRSNAIGGIFMNPQGFLDQVVDVIKKQVGMQLEGGIQYERLLGPDQEVLWQMEIFPDELPVEIGNDSLVVEVTKSVYQFIPCDSTIEKNFANGLENRQDIKLFVKLPRGFKVDTPVGRYNPDWAIVKDSGETVLLVRETKGTTNLDKLPFWQEKTKVLCGYKHFGLLGVDYKVVKLADDVR